MLEPVITTLCACVAALWLLGLIHILLTTRNNPLLLPSSEDRSDASVSILVPARNEASRILERSIASMLNQKHDRTEVIAIDDRSTDDTGEILEKLRVSSGGNLVIVSGKELPDGWLGKPFALQQGLDASCGDWILTTDADIEFAPHAVGTAVCHAERCGYDALTLLPRIDMESFWERLFMPVFGWLALMAMPLDKVNDPARPESLGVGNFFLLKRSALKALGGFDRIKSDVAEDIKLADVLKKEGFRLRIETAPTLIRTRMYRGLVDIWQGFTKNLFSALNFSVIKGIFSVASIFAFGFMPAFASPLLYVLGFQSAALFCLIAYLFQVAGFAITLKNIEQPPVYAVAIPLGFLLFALILANSMVRIVTGRGVVWKDRAIYAAGGIAPPKH